MSWPPHLWQAKRLIVGGLKALGFYGKIALEENDDGTFTAVVRIPLPAEPSGSSGPEANSARALKRESVRKRG